MKIKKQRLIIEKENMKIVLINKLNNNKYMKYSFKINHSFQSNYDDQTRENIRNYNKYISLI
ncbi:hypothetical protein A0H76_1143 [Hepatospora eriocheir]|uniref:Uncharacterized protein n=1 Tax=Hepatospora eriocheir TaxID=1081669 RepID=A0A1X0Q625_9MICR|nr:hypothetical protein A0H76_1143 [Hepatospora eriocheir]